MFPTTYKHSEDVFDFQTFLSINVCAYFHKQNSYGDIFFNFKIRILHNNLEPGSKQL